jgi:hypothetical protein
MNMNELLKANGQVSIEVFDPAGNLKEKAHIPNLVVQVGRNFIASRMKDATADVMTAMAVGEDNTTPAIGNTTLGSEIGRVSLDSTTVNNNVVTYVATFPAGTGTGGLEEAGIFNDPTAGTMLCRTTFAVVNKAAADSMVITWAITIS